MKIKIMPVLLCLLCVNIVTAQESTRAIEGTGKFDKYLTPGLLDRWVIEGSKGETVVAYVSTDEFDPILELAIPGEGEKEDTVLFSIDDKGSESRFSTRLPEDGKYAIRVHGYEFKGGGNYSLQVRRFEAKEMTVGKSTVGTIDREGQSYHWFKAAKGQVLTVDMRGTWRNLEILDVKGQSLLDWYGAATIEETGEYSLVISGNPASRYDLTIRPAVQRDLAADQTLEGKIDQNEMDVWNFEGKPGDFRLITVEQQGRLNARLIYAPREKKEVERITRRGELPEIQFVPITSKGRFKRFAAVLGRTGRYQLQLAAKTPASYTLEMKDPSQPIEAGQDLADTLPVGGSAFYRFNAVPGQLISASLKSDQFDPILSLYNDRGVLIANNDDGDGGVGSIITHMTIEKGEFRLLATSLGGGGGGRYELGLREQKLDELKIDGRATGTLEFGGTDYRKFTGKEKQTVLISARSSACDPTIRLYTPDGVLLARDENGGVGTDCLLAVKLPKSGVYTIWISAAQGAGEYTLRLIDGD